MPNNHQNVINAIKNNDINSLIQLKLNNVNICRTSTINTLKIAVMTNSSNIFEYLQKNCKKHIHEKYDRLSTLDFQYMFDLNFRNETLLTSLNLQAPTSFNRFYCKPFQIIKSHQLTLQTPFIFYIVISSSKLTTNFLYKTENPSDSMIVFLDKSIGEHVAISVAPGVFWILSHFIDSITPSSCNKQTFYDSIENIKTTQSPSLLSAYKYIIENPSSYLTIHECQDTYNHELSFLLKYNLADYGYSHVTLCTKNNNTTEEGSYFNVNFFGFLMPFLTIVVSVFTVILQIRLLHYINNDEIDGYISSPATSSIATSSPGVSTAGSLAMETLETLETIG